MQRCNNRVVATLVACCMLHATGIASQFVTFKDGQVGVNFGGYHAAAGLGGLLTGNGAHGGLSASAGTPWGPKAAAGLGGNVDGRASGVAYAGAQASSDVGASAVLGGTAGEKGFAGSEAHANSKTKAKTISGGYVDHPISTPKIPEDNGNMIQKIKPTKKMHTLFKSQSQPTVTNDEVALVRTKHVVKSYAPVNSVPSTYGPPTQGPVLGHGPPTNVEGSTNVHFNGNGAVNSALNIPIGILRSLQESLAGLRFDKTVSYSTNVKHA